MLKNQVEATVNGRRYVARVIDGKVMQLHRILPRSILQGGDFVQVWDDYRSISKNAKGRAELDAEILKQVTR